MHPSPIVNRPLQIVFHKFSHFVENLTCTLFSYSLFCAPIQNSSSSVWVGFRRWFLSAFMLVDRYDGGVIAFPDLIQFF